MSTDNDEVKWVVHSKGQAGSSAFEICVIRSNYTLGFSSYGWYCKDKLLITHNGGPCRWPVSVMVWDKLIKAAQETADELNEIEKQNEKFSG